MKRLILISSTLLMAFCLFSCNNSKNRPNDQDKKNDTTEVQCQKDTIKPEIQAQQEEVVLDDYIKCDGKIGEVTLYYKVWLNRTEDERESNSCGFYFHKNAPDVHYMLTELDNEPHVGGFNTLTLAVYLESELIGVLKGDIQGRGDGFDGTFTLQNGEKCTFELTQDWN